MPKDLEGRIYFITGANTGIGRVTANVIASRGGRVWLACRSRERAQPVLDEIRRANGETSAEFIALDLNSLQSVRACAQQFLATGEPIHCLINNAGLAGTRGLTADGFEVHFGVNHLGHFLLTELLLPAVKKAAPSRIVIVASRAHTRVGRLDFDRLRQPTRTTSGFPEYSVSKLCNVLHARELARRLEGTGVTVYALHPGVIASDIWRKVPPPFRQLAMLFMDDVNTGARTSIHCATDAALAGHSGRYYDHCKEVTPTTLAQDDALARTLWERSEAWVAQPSTGRVAANP